MYVFMQCVYVRIRAMCVFMQCVCVCVHAMCVCVFMQCVCSCNVGVCVYAMCVCVFMQCVCVCVYSTSSMAPHAVLCACVYTCVWECLEREREQENMNADRLVLHCTHVVVVSALRF